jgi:serine protease Do
LTYTTGFFVSEEGDLITCYNVLKGYHSVTVTTSDKKVYRVKNITAINKTNDLIKISLSTTDHGFNSLKLNTTPPEVGQEIIAVGGPYGFENTVSEGIVSAIRENKTQITAPVSPESSGGPVVNMNGEVIGVVSSQFLVGQNLNFAIPAYLISTLKPASSEQGKEITQPVTQGTHIYQIGSHNVSVNLSVPADYTVETPKYQ